MKIIPPQKLWQWDINKKVYISGITDADEWQVHFATDDDRTALVLPIKHDDSGYWAYIPNQLVCEGRLLLCYLYNQVEDWAHTETMIKIPVQRRPKPAGYTLVLTDIETRGSLREDIGSLSSLTTQTQNNLVDAINEVNMKKHNDLDGRDAADVHPMSSITGLEKKLQSIDSVGTGQAKAIAQLKQDIETNEATDKSQSQAISSMRQSISSIQSASESNAAAISDMQVSISSINDVDYIQSQAIADAQSDIMSLIDQDAELLQDIAALENADSTLSQSISSLASSVDSAFAEVETALDGKQPVGNYVTSVNGNAPDKGGNVSIDVQTYTAGEGIDISDSGEIAATNPMDDDRVSAGTTWSSLNVIKQLSQPFSQSGSIITCYPVDGSPLHVVSDITAVQEGEGDPSQDNIRPISGWDGANLVRCGKNLVGGNALSAESIRGNGSLSLSNQYGTTISDTDLSAGTITIVQSQVGNAENPNSYSNGLICIIIPDGFALKGQFTLTMEFKITNVLLTNVAQISIYYSGQKLVGSMPINVNSNSVQTVNTAIAFDFYINNKTIVPYLELRISGISFELYKIQLERNNAATSYEPYRGQTYTADFGETVYGGTLDWTTGILTKTHEYIASFQGESVGDEWISSTGLLSTGAEVLYRLDEPEVIQLSPQQILAISGTNTVYCDTGDVTVTGYEDPRHTVAQLTSRIAALESAATGI